MKITIQEVIESIPKHIKEKMIPVTIPKGERIIEKNNEVMFGYIFTEGIVDVMHVNSKDVLYTYIKEYPCRFIGLMEIYSGNKSYCCTCRVEKKCVGYKVSKQCFYDLLEECDLFKKYLICYWAQQFYGSSMNAARYPNNASKLKVIDYFIKKCNEQNPRSTVQITIKRDDLAEYMGCSKRTVYRLLNYLEEEGCLSKQGHVIVISLEQKKKLIKEIEK